MKKKVKKEKNYKIKSDYRNIFEYSTFGDRHNLSDYIILKNKYFIIMIDYHILVFNIFSGEQMKRYSIVEERIDNLYFDNHMQIGKWNCINDNEFFINKEGNITLFELDDSKEINLKIIGYTYFPNKKYLNILDDNKFFTYNYNENIVTIYSK